MFSRVKIRPSRRRAVLAMTVAVIGLAGFSISASAQAPVVLEPAVPAANQALVPAPAAIAAPGLVSVRQAVTEVVQQQAADAGPTADAPPADAEPSKSAAAPAPNLKSGHPRQAYSQPPTTFYKAPAYGQRFAYAPVPQYGYRHVVRPQHFNSGHAQPHFSYRGHGGQGHAAYARGNRSFHNGYGSSRH